MGSETEEEEKAMKKQFGKLSKAEQEKVELEYHRMKPEDFAEAMAKAKRHKPEARPSTKRKSKATEKKRAA